MEKYKGVKQLILPSIISEDSWFYEDNKELLEPHLGRPYISYSTSESWSDISYRPDMIRTKFLKMSPTSNVYSELGNYLGSAVETGSFPKENPNGFTGQENFSLIPRPVGADYERCILLCMGNYLVIGFVDIALEHEDKLIDVQDLKTGGKDKEKKYSGEDYTQVILYCTALRQMGYKIGKTSVYFVRRENSHLSGKPLHISSEQFEIPLEYNKERVDYALKKIDKAANEISECYKTYLKIFG